jgi:hypothetical protein
MLHTTCLRTAAALVQCAALSRRARTWGRFAQRTIDRRYCGLLAAGSFGALTRHRYAGQYPGGWYTAAVQLAGGVPSSLCWSPYHV